MIFKSSTLLKINKFFYIIFIQIIISYLLYRFYNHSFNAVSFIYVLVINLLLLIFHLFLLITKKVTYNLKSNQIIIRTSYFKFEKVKVINYKSLRYNFKHNIFSLNMNISTGKFYFDDYFIVIKVPITIEYQIKDYLIKCYYKK